MPNAISPVEIYAEELWVVGNILARGCVMVENVIIVRSKIWLVVGVEKKKKRLNAGKGRKKNVLLKVNLHGWVDSVVIKSVKGARFFKKKNRMIP